MTDFSLDEALAIPGRIGTTARRATGAHPDCICGTQKRPAQPNCLDYPIDWAEQPCGPDKAEMDAWFDRVNAPYRQAWEAWHYWRPEPCPQHDPIRPVRETP